jgi:hypothetical protein
MTDLYCEECYNTGELDCYCGGDNCVCMKNGTYPCPHCDGGHAVDDDSDVGYFTPDEIKEFRKSLLEANVLAMAAVKRAAVKVHARIAAMKSKT